MSRDQQRLLFFCALVAALPGCSNAAVVTRTTSTDSVFNDFLPDTVLFSPVERADELVSISAGQVSTFEGGTFAISADYENGSSTQVFSYQLEFDGAPYNLTQVPEVLIPNGTLIGLTFTTSNSDSAAQGMIPSGTTFTFDTASPTASAVPELPTWAMMMSGLAIAGVLLRRRAFHVLSVG